MNKLNRCASLARAVISSPSGSRNCSPAAAKPTIQLTPRQLQLLKIVASFQESQCCSPTIAELAAQLNISRSTVFEHIVELRRKALLSGHPNRARSLSLTWQAQELLSHLGDQTDPGSLHSATEIPLCGKVAAGVPLEAVEDIERLSLTGCFGTGELFALEVKGDSMVNEDIRHGDYVICRRSDVAENGQLVVAIVDQENATLKRFYKEEGQARLQPANDRYEPIYSTNCRIAAVVVGLLRRL